MVTFTSVRHGGATRLIAAHPTQQLVATVHADSTIEIVDETVMRSVKDTWMRLVERNISPGYR